MLRRFPEVFLLNALSATSCQAITGGVSIENYGDILTNDVISCSVTCTTGAQAQVDTTTIVIPTSCECPYEWGLTLAAKPCLKSWGIFNTFVKDVYYSYVNPDGSTPTADQVGAAIALQITNDPFGIATATYNGGTDTLTITERNPSITCGFNLFVDSGVIAHPTAHLDPILDTDGMARAFPIQWGQMGSTPNLPIRGADYCLFRYVIRKNADIQDIDMANTYNAYEREVLFYVCNTPTSGDYADDWETPIAVLCP
jgi:hypothetical protein